jgi:hypothetical protein
MSMVVLSTRGSTVGDVTQISLSNKKERKEKKKTFYFNLNLLKES